MTSGTFAAKAKYKREVRPTPGHSHHAEPIAASLALPDGVTVSRTALVCCRELPIGEWKTLGRTLSQFEGSLQWWIGDWWHYGFHRYGERKAMATAKGTFDRSYAFGTLMNYGYVAGRVETKRRREVLSWSHHYEIAKLDAGGQDYWLDRAVREKLSVAKLGSEIATYEWLADCCHWDARTGRTIADWKLQRYFYRLEKAAQAGERLSISPPWEHPEFESYLERYFLTHKFHPAGFITEKFDRAASFWSQTAELVRRMELKAENADMATHGVRAVAKAEGEIDLTEGVT